MFGIKQEQIADYMKLANNDFPVSMTNITFYPNNEMYLQFYEADFPNVDYGLGIGVYFKNDIIDFVEIPEADESNIIAKDLI